MGSNLRIRRASLTRSGPFQLTVRSAARDPHEALEEVSSLPKAFEFSWLMVMIRMHP